MAKPDIDVAEQPFIAHLIELRDRLLRAIVAVLILFIGLAYYANDIYSYLAGPLLKHMPAGSQMIAIEVASPFLTPFKLTAMVSVFLAIPYILYQGWAFVAPGLYRHERRLILPLLVASTFLFYGGMAFAYYVVFPLIFGFMTAAAPVGVTVMTDISQYLDFVLTIFFAFGISFEVPIATILLVWSGIVSREDMAEKRPYVIVGAFIIGMLLTPPDVVSQTLLSIPIWLLFELGLLFSRFFTRRAAEAEQQVLDQDREHIERLAPPADDL
ncbi:twin-arginine translocase subunit TatC [Methylococcus sp. EFPC2]|uniref:twin-arginine translocase subunit TatC n=1 Tax=Methylococcus sp. EFPC2 TaxID=2812648 RepID=UPI00196778D8|nr:twin-arginine translocase subunit TatC [Methylococcus sp. EFPC2]QSA96146.1 twin-arginine translocase subunit TatC [Methylococcus sp. EFPC2]